MSDKHEELNEFDTINESSEIDSFENNSKENESWDDFSFDEEINDPELSINDEFDNSIPYQSKPEKSSLNWFNIGIVGFVVIAIGAGAYMFLGGNQPATDTAQQNNNMANNQALVNQAATNTQEMPSNPFETEGGLLANPDAVLSEEDKTVIDQKLAENNTSNVFDALEETPPQISENEMQDLFAAVNEASTPAEVVSADDITNTMPAEPVQPVVAETTVSEPLVNQAVPAENSIVEQDLPAIAETTTQEILSAAQEAPVTAVETTMPQADVAALNARIEELSTSLATVLSKLETLNAPVSQPSSTDSSQIRDIEATLARLESRIDNLSSARVVNEPTVVKKKSSSTPKKSTPKKSLSNSDKAAPIEKTQWDLRGASPEQAFLAERGTQNFRTVKVGDILKGVGTIQSITSENGRWVVKGTIGTVRQ